MHLCGSDWQLARVPKLCCAKFAPQLKKVLFMKVLQDGVWGSCCHIPLSTNGATVNVELAYITAITSDDLASLKWIEGPFTSTGKSS